MQKKLKALMSKKLSDKDILRGCKGKTRIIDYSKLKNISNINQVLKNGTCVILYELEPGIGHWTLINKINNQEIEFFDSYSFKIDDELKWIPEKYKKQLGSDFPYLTRLLLPFKLVRVVPYRLQKMSKDINTCGRWVVHRVLNRKIPLMKYFKIMKDLSNKTKLSPDQLITLFTIEI